MSLVSLGEYLILLVCLELPLVDITSLRKVCRSLCEATRAKILWITILERNVSGEWKVMPPYLKGYDVLDPTALEALARRVSQLGLKWETGNLAPINNWRLCLPQSITWLRLVNGTWLFVASSDSNSSKLSCWELSLVFQGYTEPLAEAYLPGQVKTGKLEVQDSGIVIALGLGAESLSVHIITLRQHLGRHVFCELGRIEDSSHILMLSGDFVGCALRNGAVVPHIINWKDTLVHDVPPPPGGLDIPGRRNVPHLMTIWSEFLVIIRQDSLEFYTLPSTNSDVVVFVKRIRTITLWEVVVCDPVSIPVSHCPPLRLLAISPFGIEMCVVEHYDVMADLDDDSVWPSFPLAESSRHLISGHEPWYRLCIGRTGRRSLWIETSEYPQNFYTPPHFVYASIPSQSSYTEFPRISWSNDQDELALWAFPAVDFDEALGFTVVGNCFGELIICDHDGRYPERCGGLGMDFTNPHSPMPPLLPTMPIDLSLPIAPVRGMTDSELNTAMSKWSKDPLGLDDSWSTTWLGYHGYWNWDMWHGEPCDFAWLLEHAYGFPGPVIPQAYQEDLEMFTQHLLFRVGDRYMAFIFESNKQFRSWPLSSNRHFRISDAQVETCMRPTAITEHRLYDGMRANEWTCNGRNRWVELAGRGGQCDQRLLNMD
ncbi:hypothetical protein B0H19DRAFT_1229597 [Mycena capillaripes]|nr:hypothetical protein B0H19DRAFT_1229597 [Mycena capillaripes]